MLDPQLFYTPSVSGDYYLSAGAFGSNTGTYTIYVTSDDYAPYVTADDYASDAMTTGKVTIGEAGTGSIETGDDRDWFTVTLMAGTTYRFNESGSPSGGGTLSDTYLRLYDSLSNQLAFNDNSYTINSDTPASVLDSQLFYTPSVSGDYYLSAGAFGSNTGTYTIDVTSDDYASDPTTTGKVAIGQSAIGSIETSDDRDWFSVILVAGTSYRFNLRGSNSGQGTLADPLLQLRNSNGTILALDGDSGGGRDAQITYRAASNGTYYLSAKSSVSSGRGTYTISAIAPPALSALLVAADNASQGDTMTVRGNGQAGNTIMLRDFEGGTSIGTTSVAGDGTWALTTAAPLSIGTHLLWATQSDGINTSPASAAVQVKITLATPNAVTFFGTAATDNFTGGAGKDTFQFSAANLSNSDTLAGGLDSDTLQMTTGGTINAVGLSGVETFTFSSAAANTLILTDANFANVTGGAISVTGGNAGNTVNGSALTGVNRLIFVGGAGLDNVSGGSGNDLFKFTAAALSNTDMVSGGLGSDTLQMTSGGTINAAGLSGVETFTLSGNTLILTDANFANVTGGAMSVTGGYAGNTVNGSALTGVNRLIFVGGAGLDNVSGGSGNDLFKFTAAALSNTDTVSGGSGSDTLQMTTGGTINAAALSGVETFTLSSAAARHADPDRRQFRQRDG